MILRTTKQIIEHTRSEIDFYSFKSVEGKKLIAYPLIDDKKGKEIINKVWVGLDELQKEIEKCFELKPNNKYDEGYHKALKDVLRLYNSQKQKLTPVNPDVFKKNPEEQEKFIKNCVKVLESSPVTNTKKISSSVVIKKCTCKKPYYNNPEINRKNDYKCGRCGGEL